MDSLNQRTVESRRQPRSPVWLLALVMVVACVLAWAVAARTVPASGATASDAATAALATFDSPPAFLSPVYLPAILRQPEVRPQRSYLPLVLRQ
jgi:hypothetical protein